jgi:hypothetical protein
MYISREVLFFVISALGVFFWWYYRRSIRESRERDNLAREDFIHAINELKEAITKLTEAQTKTNLRLERLQAQHDTFTHPHHMVPHHYPEPERQG